MKRTQKKVTAMLILMMVLVFGGQIQAAAKTYTMYVGRTYTLRQSGAKKWTTSNKKIAKVNSKSGKVTPLRAGRATIKAKKKKGTAAFRIIVKKPYISKTKLTLQKGKTATLKLTGTTAKTWKSSKSSIVSVSSKGTVKAKAPGTAVITVRGSDRKTYQCKITVPKPPVPQKQPETEKKQSETEKQTEPQKEPPTEPQTEPVPEKFNGYLIMHRGYQKIAPENTLSAYRLAAEMGYRYVECDIQFTQDSVPMLLHDYTVTRTSNAASVTIKTKLSDMTLEEVKQLDFGSWKSPNYAGEKIPTFREFLELCQQYGLHPYVELKLNGMQKANDNAATRKEKVRMLYITACNLNMQNQITWISFDPTLLCYMRDIDKTSELGWLRGNEINPSTIAGARALQQNKDGTMHKVYIMPFTNKLSDEMLEECKKYNIGLIAQGIHTQAAKDKMGSYYTAGISNGF